MIFWNILIAVSFIIVVVLLVFSVYKIKNLNDYIYDLKETQKDSIRNIKKNYDKQIEQIRNELQNEINETISILNSEKQKKQFLQSKIDSVNCVVCGNKSDGKHFCFSCYSKFKNQSIDIRFKNCKDTSIVDYWGNKTEPCEDGRKVRSRAEQCIANYFYNNKIRYSYEKPINFEGKILHPDFYLPDYDLYIEYNELKDEEYTSKKNFAMKIYQKLNIKIVIMTKEDRENIYEYFCRLLHK